MHVSAELLEQIMEAQTEMSLNGSGSKSCLTASDLAWPRYIQLESLLEQEGSPYMPKFCTHGLLSVSRRANVYRASH